MARRHADGLTAVLAPALVGALETVLPRVPGALVGPVSEVGGTLAYAASPAARRAVRGNQLVVAPARRPRVRRAFVNQVRNYVDTFRLLRLTREQLRRSIEVVGWDSFVSAYERGKGVIMCSAHFGPLVICGQIFVANGMPVTLPVERESGPLAAAVNRARRALGMTVVAIDSAFGIHRVLRSGGILGFVADRPVSGVGERVPFFGREALLPSAHVAFALRTGAPLVAGFAHRRGGRLIAHFEPPLTLVRTGDHGADVRAGVREFARVMERHIARAPDEWQAFAPVWDRSG